MAECLEFGIGISSTVFVAINKCISPRLLKMKYTPYSQLLKKSRLLEKKNNHQKHKKPTQKSKPTKQTKKSFQVAQTIYQAPAARNSPPKSLIPAYYSLKNPQRPSRDMTVEVSSTVQWLNICVILRRRLKIRFWPQPQASTNYKDGSPLNV